MAKVEYKEPTEPKVALQMRLIGMRLKIVQELRPEHNGHLPFTQQEKELSYLRVEEQLEEEIKNTYKGNISRLLFLSEQLVGVRDIIKNINHERTL